MVFNKRLLDAYALESPYAMVDENRWVLDNVYEMVRKVSADLDGDGKMTATDQWGMAAEGFDTYAQFIGCGERIFKNNADGYPELTVYNERAVSVIDKYMSMVADTENYTTAVTVRTYNQGNAFLMATTMMTIRLFFRTMDDDFGMVPVPKYDEYQENYREVVSCGTSGAMIGVPITTKDPEFAGFVLEALSAESHKVLIPAYYDICFSTKYLRDEESVGMLDLVFANRVFEPSILYDWGGWYTYFAGLSATSTVDLASTYASKMDQTLAALEKTVAAYDAAE